MTAPASDRRASAPDRAQGATLKASAAHRTASLVVDIKLSVIVHIDADAQPLTKAIVAEEAMAWLKTCEEHGQLDDTIDCWTILDRIKE